MSTTPEQRAYWRKQAEQEVSEQASAHPPRRFSAVTALALLDDLEAAHAENAMLREVLQCLHDEQNGPPLSLPRHKSAWEQAMRDAEAALSRPGPGVALLERFRATEALLRKVRAAVEWSEDVELLAEIDAAIRENAND